MKRRVLVLAFACVCLLGAVGLASAARRKLSSVDAPSAPSMPTAAGAPVTAAGGPIGGGPMSGSYSGNSDNSRNDDRKNDEDKKKNDDKKNDDKKDIPGIQEGFLGNDGKDQNDQPGIISVNSKATVDVKTDHLKICVALKTRCYASGYEPGGKIYSASAADASAAGSADSFGSYRPTPSGSELSSLMRNCEEEISSGLEKLVDFLSDNKVMHLTSNGITLQPIYDYGCWLKSGCNYGQPIIIGYTAVVQLCFEIPISRADDLVKACIGQYQVLIVEITFVASEDCLLDGEKQAIKRAVFEAARKASTVGKALAQLNDDDDKEFDSKPDDDKNYGAHCRKCDISSYSTASTAASTGTVDAAGNNRQDNQEDDKQRRRDDEKKKRDEEEKNKFGFDLELIKIRCKTKDNDYLRPYFTAPTFMPEASMISAAGYSGGGGYDSCKDCDYSSYYRAKGIVEQVEVECKLVVRIEGKSGENRFGEKKDHHNQQHQLQQDFSSGGPSNSGPGNGPFNNGGH